MPNVKGIVTTLLVYIQRPNNLKMIIENVGGWRKIEQLDYKDAGIVVEEDISPTIFPSPRCFTFSSNLACMQREEK